ncbi:MULTISPECIES: transposase [Eubacteriales]|uniref:transposase n=1 Tax=Eubacteriales TaxID=186802 RepID=UPI002FD9913D
MAHQISTDGEYVMENCNSDFAVRLGRTTFIVCIKQSQTAKKPLERIIKDVCRHEVLGDFRTGKS